MYQTLKHNTEIGIYVCVVHVHVNVCVFIYIPKVLLTISLLEYLSIVADSLLYLNILDFGV